MRSACRYQFTWAGAELTSAITQVSRAEACGVRTSRHLQVGDKHRDKAASVILDPCLEVSQHLTTVRSRARIQTQVPPVLETAPSWARRRVDVVPGLLWKLVAHSRGDKPAASGSNGPKTSLPWCGLYLKFISNLLFIVGKYT